MVLEAVAPTVSDIFTTAGSVMTGATSLAGDFFTTLWANPIGQLSIGATVMGLGFYVFRKILHKGK